MTLALRKCVSPLSLSFCPPYTENIKDMVAGGFLFPILKNGAKFNVEVCIMAGEFVIDSPQKLKSKLEMVILFHFLSNMSILLLLTSFSSLVGCAVGGSLL